MKDEVDAMISHDAAECGENCNHEVIQMASLSQEGRCAVMYSLSFSTVVESPMELVYFPPQAPVAELLGEMGLDKAFDRVKEMYYELEFREAKKLMARVASWIKHNPHDFVRLLDSEQGIILKPNEKAPAGMQRVRVSLHSVDEEDKQHLVELQREEHAKEVLGRSKLIHVMKY